MIQFLPGWSPGASWKTRGYEVRYSVIGVYLNIFQMVSDVMGVTQTNCTQREHTRWRENRILFFMELVSDIE